MLTALAHITVAAIHPFADGNGLTARTVTSLALLRGGYRRPEFTSLEEWWGTHTAKYHEAFAVLGGAVTNRYYRGIAKSQRQTLISALKWRVEER